LKVATKGQLKGLTKEKNSQYVLVKYILMFLVPNLRT